MTTDVRLDSLKQRRPEWQPWLGVVEVALREAKAPVWREMVPELVSSGRAPRLAHATIRLRGAVLHAYLKRLLSAAAASGTREMGSLREVSIAAIDPVGVFHAALCQRQHAVACMAPRGGAHPEAFAAVAMLVPVPFLQACAASWRGAATWVEPYCPVCGSWPAFAEVRGIERTRYYRCGRCGSDWHAHGLSCPFCGTTDHRDLVRLVPGDPGASSAVEACRRCHGYVKSYNRLQACARADVLLEDLGGAALDFAAIEQGYSRPATPGHAFDVSIVEA